MLKFQTLVFEGESVRVSERQRGMESNQECFLITHRFAFLSIARDKH